ncbi:hypothetical protein ACPPVT_07690 [Angustibacter sp. McL0619]|uniref:hypothetical protein n=1 Tax=Angustibacter sp. McL0619 TaxID=3415676 RepID=UPI003CEE4B28
MSTFTRWSDGEASVDVDGRNIVIQADSHLVVAWPPVKAQQFALDLPPQDPMRLAIIAAADHLLAGVA